MTKTEFNQATADMGIKPILREAATRALVDGATFSATDRELDLAQGSTRQIVGRINTWQSARASFFGKALR